MPPAPAPTSWNGFSITLHWLVAAMVLGLAVVGLFMTELPNNPTKLRIYALHKSMGLTVLALVGLRLAWRLLRPAPSPVPGTPRWQQVAATATHWAMYVLLFAIPLSGWAYNSAANFPLQWFGLFNLPDLIAADLDAKPFWKAVHWWSFCTLAALALMHAGAALKHHYLDRDATLVRMLPRFARGGTTRR
jgi:cytochrome b561